MSLDAHTAMVFASAISLDRDTARATRELFDVLAGHAAHGVDLVVIFSTRHHQRGLEAVCERFEDAFSPTVLIGCTAAGVIGGGREVEADEPGLCVLIGRLPGAKLMPFRFDSHDWPAIFESPGQLREAIPVIGPRARPRCILMLADLLSTPIHGLLAAFDGQFPGVPIVGGLVGDGRRPGGGRLVLGHARQTEGVVGVAIGGRVEVAHTLSQGCRPVGRPLVITRGRGQVIEQLGGRTALAMIRDVVSDLGPREHKLIHRNGLRIGRVIDEYKSRFGPADLLARALMDVNQETGAITVGDRQIAVGQTVQLLIRDDQAAADDLALALEAQKIHGPGRGGLLFSCRQRGSKLFGRPHADAAQVRQAIGEVPLVGAFTAGEFTHTGGRNLVQGHAASLVVFRSPDDAAVLPAMEAWAEAQA